MKIIDLRSDTVTLPTDEMRQSMADAEVGDDVYGEDPTVNHLEKLAAEMMGKEAALFTPSGTMSNLIAVLSHTRPGQEIILGSQSHMFWYEVGGASALGGVMVHTIPNNERGELSPDDLTQAIRPRNIHFPESALVALENTHNRCGGAFLTPEYTATIAGIAHHSGLRLHLDGARIFNAAIAQNIAAKELAQAADSVCFCLSKGLSAPVGSLLCGTGEFVERARKWRKMLGGGMRQAGVLAAAGIVALKTMICRLAEDHANARRLACGLANIPGIEIEPERYPTNIVLFLVPKRVSAPDLVRRLQAQGIRLMSRNERQVRAVTHRMVSASDIDEALNRIEAVLRG